MPTKLEKVLVKPQTTILETLKVIDNASLEIALVVDKNQKLLGTVTDGDIRRGIIKGIDLNQPIDLLMGKTPITAQQNTPNDELIFLMTNRSIKHLPIVDNEGKLIKLVLLKDLVEKKARPNKAVIMAGGLGSRLGELTKHTPKPLLPVGNKPIIAVTVEQLAKHGIQEIFISVNYKAEMIKDFFKANPPANTKINFLEEKEFLGTAGSLSLLPPDIETPLLVMNGDILSPVNYGNLLDYHIQSGRSMTVCTREYNFEIPYGVLVMRGNELVNIEEKPSHSIFINAGIYVLSPTVLKKIPSDQRYDMPDLIKTINAEMQGISCFPLSDFWLDIGNPKDYSKAREAFAKIYY